LRRRRSRAPLSIEVAPNIHRLHAHGCDGVSQFVFAAAELGAPVAHEVLRIEADAIRSGRTFAQASRHRAPPPAEIRRILRRERSSDNHAMDADELARIAAALVGAIAEASAHVKDFGIDSQFRELVRRTREMHDLLVEAMIANEALQTEYLSGLSVTAENAIDQLEALATMPDGKMQKSTTCAASNFASDRHSPPKTKGKASAVSLTCASTRKNSRKLKTSLERFSRARRGLSRALNCQWHLLARKSPAWTRCNPPPTNGR